ncbi:hypothetical protein QBC38DRAFT_475990 [Podospora fimiseda]|uniref:Uncharacterized protein n=1 Tax=Podospora fimiseda TaxID=252190 RepID=A0AAN7BRP7_9PEZI|nr:hypothetical protein QBC38DRAFT_475990 [Podospora fimiseda]
MGVLFEVFFFFFFASLVLCFTMDCIIIDLDRLSWKRRSKQRKGCVGTGFYTDTPVLVYQGEETQASLEIGLDGKNGTE